MQPGTAPPRLHLLSEASPTPSARTPARFLRSQFYSFSSSVPFITHEPHPPHPPTHPIPPARTQARPHARPHECARARAHARARTSSLTAWRTAEGAGLDGAVPARCSATRRYVRFSCVPAPTPARPWSGAPWRLGAAACLGAAGEVLVRACPPPPATRTRLWSGAGTRCAPWHRRRGRGACGPAANDPVREPRLGKIIKTSARTAGCGSGRDGPAGRGISRRERREGGVGGRGRGRRGSGRGRNGQEESERASERSIERASEREREKGRRGRTGGGGHKRHTHTRRRPPGWT